MLTLCPVLYIVSPLIKPNPLATPFAPPPHRTPQPVMLPITPALPPLPSILSLPFIHCLVFPSLTTVTLKPPIFTVLHLHPLTLTPPKPFTLILQWPVSTLHFPLNSQSPSFTLPPIFTLLSLTSPSPFSQQTVEGQPSATLEGERREGKGGKDR